MIHAGIDLHANNMVIVAINDNAEVVQEAKLPTYHRSLEDFLGTFDRPVQAVVECTSFCFWLYDWCRVYNFYVIFSYLKMYNVIIYLKIKFFNVVYTTIADLIDPDLH